MEDPTKIQAVDGAACEPIPINKVGEYCEGAKGNATLPNKCNEM